MNNFSRTKNSIRNIIFGLIYKVLALILPFIARTIIIYYLGIQYVGLSSLFTSILSMLNLAELGVGSAIVYSMYDAVAKNDEELICALLKVYKKVYTIIGIVILCIGLMILPFIGNIITGEIPTNINIYILYLFYLINTVVTYLLFAYKNSLFIAYQRNDLISKISAFVLVVQNILQIIFLVCTQNYYLYIIWMIIGNILKNLIINILSKKLFPTCVPQGNVNKIIIDNITKKVKALFLYKIGGMVLTSVDSIVISAMIGLTELGKYNNYYFIITSLFAFLAIFYDSVRPGIGNSLVIERKEKNLKDFYKLFLLNSWLVGWCSVCLLCMYEPFMKLWVEEKHTFPFVIVILFTIYFYIWKMMEVVNLYKDAAGMWEYDKYRPIIASIVNLFFNIVLVKLIGIYGILISTIISILIVIFPWSTVVLFKYYFYENKYDMIKYFRKYFIYTLITIFTCAITYSICQLVQSVTILGVLYRFIICCIIPNVIFIFLLSFDKDFNDTIVWLYTKFNFLRRKKYEEK